MALFWDYPYVVGKLRMTPELHFQKEPSWSHRCMWFLKFHELPLRGCRCSTPRDQSGSCLAKKHPCRMDRIQAHLFRNWKNLCCGSCRTCSKIRHRPWNPKHRRRDVPLHGHVGELPFSQDLSRMRTRDAQWSARRTPEGSGERPWWYATISSVCICLTCKYILYI